MQCPCLCTRQRAAHGPSASRLHTPGALRRRGCRHSMQEVAAFTIHGSDGMVWQVDKGSFAIGSRAGSDLRLMGDQVAAEHAVLLQQGKQVYAKALVGEDMFDDSLTWLDGDQLRPGVQYVLASGAVLAFGTPGSPGYRVDFEEPSGSNPLVEMLMQGMTAGASGDVKQALDRAKGQPS